MKLDLKTVKTNVKQITIEPVLFLYALSYGCYAVITSKLYLDKVSKYTIVGINKYCLPHFELFIFIFTSNETLGEFHFIRCHKVQKE